MRDRSFDIFFLDLHIPLYFSFGSSFEYSCVTRDYCSLYRPLLKQIKNSAESHIVLDCSTDRIYDVLKQAQQIGMMSDYHSYLITSLVGTSRLNTINNRFLSSPCIAK